MFGLDYNRREKNAQTRALSETPVRTYKINQCNSFLVAHYTDCESIHQIVEQSFCFVILKIAHTKPIFTTT